MPRHKKEGTAEDSHVTDSGIVVDGKVVVGKKHNLSDKEQGEKARGEIDDTGEKTGKTVEAVKVMTPTETLYQGDLSCEAISAATGEEISWKWHQAMPTTEEGCYRVMENAFGPGMVKRETFKLDVTNSIDPTKRTALEKV